MTTEENARLPHRALFLIGFMGAGKTTVGRHLATRLQWQFLDLDDRIVFREGRSIPELFQTVGETGFRQAESRALEGVMSELTSMNSRVIALGGGAFAQPHNRQQVLAERLPVIFLDAPVEELWRRCQNQSTIVQRPMIRDEQHFHSLYYARRPLYVEGTRRIDTMAKSTEDITEEIACWLEQECRA